MERVVALIKGNPFVRGSAVGGGLVVGGAVYALLTGAPPTAWPTTDLAAMLGAGSLAAGLAVSTTR